MKKQLIQIIGIAYFPSLIIFTLYIDSLKFADDKVIQKLIPAHIEITKQLGSTHQNVVFLLLIIMLVSFILLILVFKK